MSRISIRILAIVLSLMICTTLPSLESENSQQLMKEGFALLAKGDQASALPKLEAALEFSEAAGDRHSQALGSFLVGALKAQQQGLEKTLEDFTKSQQIFEEIGDHFGTWMVRLGRSQVLDQMGRHDEALAALQKIMEWIDEIERSGSIGSFDTLKVLVASQQQLPPGMLDQMDALLPMMQPILLLTFKTSTLLMVSKALRSWEQYEDALAKLEQAMTFASQFPGMDAPILQEMAIVKRLLGHDDEAAADEARARERAAQTAGGMVDPQLQQGFLDMLMKGGASQDPRAVTPLESLEERLAEARGRGDVRSEAVLLALIGREYSKQKRREEASFYYERSLETARILVTRSDKDAVASTESGLFTTVQSDVEVEEFLDAFSEASARDVHDALLLLAAQDGQATVAFDFAERARADGDQTDDARFLFVEHLGLEELRGEVLDAETSLVAFYVAGPKVLAWVVDRADARHRILDLPEPDLLQRARGLVDVGSEDFDFAAAHDVYQALIEPLAPWVRHHHLVVVPHGVLDELPFESLHDDERRQFLAERYTVTRIPNVGLMRGPIQ